MAAIIERDLDLIKLAREIAIDHYDIDDLLTRYQLTYDQWNWLLQHPRFTHLLASEEEAWHAAKNTKERVRLKSAALIESYLDDAAKSLLSPNESLVAKTGLAKLVAGFAGIGTEADQKGLAGGGSGFSITINLGDKTLNVSTGRHNLSELSDEPDLSENTPKIDHFGPKSSVFERHGGALDVFEINADLS